MAELSFDLVIPTIGRASLRPLLEALAASEGPRPGRILVVDDRNHPDGPLPVAGLSRGLAARIAVLSSGGRGPAAARNTGWRATTAEWVVFVDDDVEPPPRWLRALAEDLAGLPEFVGGSQGRIRVPLPGHRPPTDWERNVKGLEIATWATADMAYRRSVLAEAGGFDERFPRAYREDADLGLRVSQAGYRILRGRRMVVHPVRPPDPWVSVRLQWGNADDALMRMLHGRDWQLRACIVPGRRSRHLVVTAAGLAALAGSTGWLGVLSVAGVVLWVAGTAELAWRRISPGPKTPGEVATMVATSVLIPPVATYHWLRGLIRATRLARSAGRASAHPVQRLPSAA